MIENKDPFVRWGLHMAQHKRCIAKMDRVSLKIGYFDWMKLQTHSATHQAEAKPVQWYLPSPNPAVAGVILASMQQVLLSPAKRWTRARSLGVQQGFATSTLNYPEHMDIPKAFKSLFPYLETGIEMSFASLSLFQLSLWSWDALQNAQLSKSPKPTRELQST